MNQREELLARKRSTVSGNGNGQAAESLDRIEYVSISQETRRRYLNYALSVIQSRALPDVRDGLKPVQRRILFVMYHDLRLLAGSHPRKSARICGDTMGGYHPHGDAAIYDALVRMAQDFTFRYPLVDGQGNFGSVMGLPAAASRYTEARLTPIAEQLMEELRYQTVDMRPNYDATRQEPVVLPARFPNLLVNGSQGIAVGMATSIPPHNLKEVVKACIYLIRHPDATVAQLMKYIKGPDFPLGGRIVTDRRQLVKTYKEGRGSIKVRGEWKLDSEKRGKSRIVVYSVPYGVETGSLMAELGQIVLSRKLPQLVDVADETDEKNGLRIVLELKQGADPELVMTYLYKHTALEQNFNYNATCLVPDSQGVLVPRRLSLVDMLRHFLDFRFETVRRRFQFQLAQLKKRIHILEGFAKVFKGLSEAIRIIRQSRGKADASQKLQSRFGLDEEQANAVLELQLYRISRLEIDQILSELKDKRAEAKRIENIVRSNARLWKVVQTELAELGERFGDRRRTSIGSSEEIAEFDAQAYIVKENTNVVVTRDGWVKRVGRLTSVETTRVREGDAVLDVVPGSTLDNVVVFSSDGVAYTLPINNIVPSSGYGEPLSKHVKLADGASVVAVVTTDPRFTPPDEQPSDDVPTTPHLFVATAAGQVLRVPLAPYRSPSTKAGRKYCRLRKGDRVVFVQLVRDAQTVFLATRQARVIHFPIEEVPVLSGPGVGVRGIKLEEGDEVLGATLLSRPSDCLRVRNSNDRVLAFGQMKYSVTSRGGKGVKTSHRTTFEEILRPEIQLVDWNQVE